jgi:hypothetical protein
VKYRVEIFTDNEWHRWSTHKHQENAVFNAEVISKSRRCDVRVIYKGEIVFQRRGDENRDR